MRDFFGAIAPRYDFITRALSFGMDDRWKREAVAMARRRIPAEPHILDLACGTGDFSQLIRSQLPTARITAVDLTEKMLRLARERGQDSVASADACRLPFADETFDGVFVGYGLRNFPRLEEALREIHRVTRRDGQFVSLDFFLPVNSALREFYLACLFAQGAFWGLALHGRPRTYTYIPDSLRRFVSAEELARLLARSHYEEIETRQFLFGGIGIHHATKI